MNYDNHNKTHSIHGLQHFQDLVDGLQTDKNKLVTYRDFYPLSEINLTAHKRGQLKKIYFPIQYVPQFLHVRYKPVI